MILTTQYCNNKVRNDFVIIKGTDFCCKHHKDILHSLLTSSTSTIILNLIHIIVYMIEKIKHLQRSLHLLAAREFIRRFCVNLLYFNPFSIMNFFTLSNVILCIFSLANSSFISGSVHFIGLFSSEDQGQRIDYQLY